MQDRRIPALDGYRVVLVFLVSWYHIWQQSWWTPSLPGVGSLDFLMRSGYVHVDGMILLSGFLLFLPWAREMLDGAPQPQIREFYRRRVARIVPSYYAFTLGMLLLVALPHGLYANWHSGVKDVFLHLTFLQNQDVYTYLGTPLGVASWTIALEMQFYLIFPWIARAANKRPALTIGAMILAGLGYRAFQLNALTDYNLVVNQLPAFLDVYAVGMICAMAYVKLEKGVGEKRWFRCLATLGAVGLIWVLTLLLKQQAYANGQAGIQAGQMARRPFFALCYGGVALTLALSVRPVQWALGNRVMHTLAGLSMNYYLAHQCVAVELKRLGFPPSVNELPNQAGEQPWQTQYTWLCFGLSLLLAALLTYGVEKPCARAIRRAFQKYDEKRRRKQQMKDPRMVKLAKNLVNYSCRVQPGEKVWIEGTGVPAEFMAQLVEETYAAGGVPFVNLRDPKVERAMGMGYTAEQLDWLAEGDAKRMSECQAYIGVRAGDNSYETGDVPQERTALYAKRYGSVVHGGVRVPHTKWVVLRYPVPAMAQQAGMSTEAFEDYYFNVCNLDYGRMSKAMDALVRRMEAADQVHITGRGTDLRFSMKGLPAIKCAGEANIPDGEVFSAPVVGTIEGEITYNTPSLYQGVTFENIHLVFREGRIVEATANDTKRLNEILDTDEGARRVGEFAIGVNPYITSAMKDTLFDEKIAGSFHFTPGRCYDDCDNGNRSAIHWDLVCIQTPEYGGGEMYFDGELIRKDGRFVPEDLQGLNPEHLK